ncbi:hypothetical protein C1645_832291 [Glomus cerebriforme]|uniref:Uncharacterized protein n=1 Tax=Glomus cerebriforme TaxID=658196 RepID=A0A397SEJ6_9GLOM|nr:hypothetical protein C1645_832291 [Glomus cerebriforme]
MSSGIKAETDIYNSFKNDDDSKKKLSSERIVKEELYKLKKDLEFKYAIHSFILDVDNKLIAEHFTEAELHEIEDTFIPEISELSDKINNLLNKFIDEFK